MPGPPSSGSGRWSPVLSRQPDFHRPHRSYPADVLRRRRTQVSHDPEATRRQLVGVLQGVVAQVLLPRIGGGRIAAFEVLFRSTSTVNTDRGGELRQPPQRARGACLGDGGAGALTGGAGAAGEVSRHDVAVVAND